MRRFCVRPRPGRKTRGRRGSAGVEDPPSPPLAVGRADPWPPPRLCQLGVLCAKPRVTTGKPAPTSRRRRFDSAREGVVGAGPRLLWVLRAENASDALGPGRKYPSLPVRGSRGSLPAGTCLPEPNGGRCLDAQVLEEALRVFEPAARPPAPRVVQATARQQARTRL
jgi:hypothetical protein